MLDLQAPGGVMLIVATHADKLPKDVDLKQKSEELLSVARQYEQRATSNIKNEISVLK